MLQPESHHIKFEGCDRPCGLATQTSGFARHIRRESVQESGVGGHRGRPERGANQNVAVTPTPHRRTWPDLVRI